MELEVSIWSVLFVSAAVAATAASSEDSRISLAISTWPFVEAVKTARSALEWGASAVDAVVEGCSTCESLQCDGSVGYGGSPDENGETTLDAMVMDGTTMDVGAVGSLRSVKDAAKAARLVLHHTEHTLLVGYQASAFAISLGLPGPVNLSTDESLQKSLAWRESAACQPNFWKNVVPDNKHSCGPYKIVDTAKLISDSPAVEERQSCPEPYQTVDTVRRVSDSSSAKGISRHNHDTISMAAIDKNGNIAVGTSTNGATYKIPGRVGDGPIVGAGAYADTEVGACGATGDGDIMMRFLPCYQVVENMRLGMSPQQAATDAIARIRRKYPSFLGALFAVNKQGEHAGACHGWTFRYSVWKTGMKGVEVFTVLPT